MTPKGFMLLGTLVGIVASVVEIASYTGISVAVFAFAGGSLFGKGYGIWEERSRKRKTPRRQKAGPPDAWFYYDEDED